MSQQIINIVLFYLFLLTVVFFWYFFLRRGGRWFWRFKFCFFFKEYSKCIDGCYIRKFFLKLYSGLLGDILYGFRIVWCLYGGVVCIGQGFRIFFWEIRLYLGFRGVVKFLQWIFYFLSVCCYYFCLKFIFMFFVSEGINGRVGFC